LDIIGEDLIICDLPDGSIKIENPNTNRAITINDNRLLGPLGISMRETKLNGFKSSFYGEGFKIRRETNDSLRIILDDTFVIVKDSDVFNVYCAVVTCCRRLGYV
jgi:hypothetical protein